MSEGSDIHTCFVFGTVHTYCKTCVFCVPFSFAKVCICNTTVAVLCTFYTTEAQTYIEHISISPIAISQTFSRQFFTVFLGDIELKLWQNDPFVVLLLSTVEGRLKLLEGG